MTDKTFEKYKLIVDEYFINGFNGRKAWQKFNPKSSDETADVEFNRILSIPKVKGYYNNKHKDAQKVLRTSHEVLLQELENWAYSDITETLLLTPEQLKELPEEVRRLITKFETNTKTYIIDDRPVSETTVKLWFVSKEKAMEMIHKHTGFYEKDNLQRNSHLTEAEREARIKELKAKLKGNID